MLSTTTLVWLLALAAVASLGAGVVTVVALCDTRRDLLHVRNRGIGNGRRAAAEGEYLLAWARLGHAGVSLAATSTLIYATVDAVGLGNEVRAVWAVVVALVTVSAVGLCLTAIAAGRIRRRVLHLGLEDPTQRGSDRHSPEQGS